MEAAIDELSTTVIIPAYNSERTIIRALESVRNQTESKHILEILVINDGSTDSTEQLVNEYNNKHPECQIRLITKENGGVSKARNTGLKEAKGNWIALLDSDDEWYSEKLHKQFEIIKSHPEVDFLGANHLDHDIKILGRRIDQLYKPSVKELCIKMFPQTSTTIFRKKIFDEIGGYDENRQYCEDGQFFFRICERYNYYYMPEQLITFDSGRRGFGVSGLSANLKGMQDGQRKNNRELFDRKAITFPFYVFISAFSELKYIRRIIICKMEKK